MTEPRSDTEDRALQEIADAWANRSDERGWVSGQIQDLLTRLSAALAAKEAAEAERNDLRRVKGTDYEVVAYDGEAHVAKHYEQTSWDSPPEAELMGSVGDLIRKLDEMEARAERLSGLLDESNIRGDRYFEQRNEALTRVETAEAENETHRDFEDGLSRQRDHALAAMQWLGRVVAEARADILRLIGQRDAEQARAERAEAEKERMAGDLRAANVALDEMFAEAEAERDALRAQVRAVEAACTRWGRQGNSLVLLTEIRAALAAAAPSEPQETTP